MSRTRIRRYRFSSAPKKLIKWYELSKLIARISLYGSHGTQHGILCCGRFYSMPQQHPRTFKPDLRVSAHTPLVEITLESIATMASFYMYAVIVTFACITLVSALSIRCTFPTRLYIEIDDSIVVVSLCVGHRNP